MSTMEEMTMKQLRSFKLNGPDCQKVMAQDLFDELILLCNLDDEKDLRNLFANGIKDDVNEYFTLVNQYARDEFGYELSPNECDDVVAICDGYDDGNWGEEHLQSALKDWRAKQSY